MSPNHASGEIADLDKIKGQDFVACGLSCVFSSNLTMVVIALDQDSQFQVELANAGTKLVVVDFFATW